MVRVWKAVRYSAVGVFFAGIISTITSCTDQEQITALLLLILMLLTGSGGGEAIGSGGGSGSGSAPPATGEIGDTILNLLAYDTLGGEPDIIEVGTGVFAIAYSGPANDGFVTTVSIDAAGNIGAAIIDSLVFETDSASGPDIIEVGTGVFAIAYSGPANDGFVTTVSIDAAGNIGAAIIDSLEYDFAHASSPDIKEVGTGVFAIAYGGSTDGLVTTVSIDAAGNIGAGTLDTLAYAAAASASDAKLIEVGNGVFAIAYMESFHGFVATVSIDAAGNIGAAIIDSLEFDTVLATQPDIIEVGTGVFAISYTGQDSDGFVITVSIDAAGDIGAAIIDSLEFNIDTGFQTTIIEVGNGVFAIAYRGPDFDGFVTTVSIDAAGDIGAAIIDSLEFAPTDGTFPDIIKVGTGVFAIAYVGPGGQGTVTTVAID